MAELARGTVGDRPWGRTLAALAARGLTGQVSIICDGKLYQIVFEQGAIVGAESPLAADSAVRVALTLHLVSSTQVSELSRRQAANPNRDEIDVIADYARIAPDQAMRLRRRMIATRAARTFAIDHGDFVVEDHVDTLVMAGTELDVRAIIYMGAIQHLTEERLASELGKLGHWFQIKPAMVPELAQFGFTDAERPILQALVAGTSLAALESSGVDVRSARAAVYALSSAGACDTEAPQRANAPPAPRAQSRHHAPSQRNRRNARRQPVRHHRSPRRCPTRSPARGPTCASTRSTCQRCAASSRSRSMRRRPGRQRRPPRRSRWRSRA